MDKSCQRCENEPRFEDLPIGTKCLEALRAELGGYEDLLAASEKTRLENRKADLEEVLTPYLHELSEVEIRLSEIEAAEEKKVVTELRTEAEEAERLSLEADNARLEAEAKAAELAIENAELAAEVETIEALTKELAPEGA